MSKEQQVVYDVIKNVREGYATQLSFNGEQYLIVPYGDCEQGFFLYDGVIYRYSCYLCEEVLCKYHGNKIGIQTICWKDAGPNPRLYNLGGFIPFKNVYGVAIKMGELDGMLHVQEANQE